MNNEYIFNNLLQIMFNLCKLYDDVYIVYVYYMLFFFILLDNYFDIFLLFCYIYLVLYSGCYIFFDSYI